MALTEKLVAIGDAIRDKTGETAGLTLDQMVVAIGSIEGREPVVESIEITENGVYEPAEGVDGYNKVFVEIPIPEPEEPVLVSIDIIENGTYVPTSGIDGYNEINVKVPSGGGGGEEIEPIVLSGTLSYGCSGAVSSAFCKMFPDEVSTKDIEMANNMFFNYANESIPFELNFKSTVGGINLNYFFSNAKIKTLPKFNNCKPDSTTNFFTSCSLLREIPEDFGSDWDWSRNEGYTTAYSGSRAYMFEQCISLRKIPLAFLNHGNPYANYSYSIYMGMCNNCYVLDELADLPFPHTQSNWTSNSLANMATNCYRLKRLTFATSENGSPAVMNWKNQTLDLTSGVGYCGSLINSIIRNNSGITEDKRVTDDATYQALKNDPDWFTSDVNYSRYNHDSAVETINSLPDTTISGGTNTIKFKGTAGAKTDGGAINTLTQEEIAVAAAKGWTVSYTSY